MDSTPKRPAFREVSEVFFLKNGVLWRRARDWYSGTGHKACSRREAYAIEVTANSGNGYCLVGINGKMHLYHVLVWTLGRGQVPHKVLIDHKNGNKLDNRLCNLRLVTHRGNSSNQPHHRSGKFPGVRLVSSGRFQCRIRVGGREIGLGTFDSAAEAWEARLHFCREYSLH